ncbi:MAG: ABC-F family ATP-binding cassette domain-containing protein [Bdellovibrionota bacterium]
MIQANQLSKGFGTQLLFEDVSFNMTKGERVGLVGRNGSGKTTLFKIILGEEHADSGEIIYPKNYTIGTLKQHLHFTEKTIIAECSLALSKEEEFDTYKVEKMLHGLGFKTEDFERPPSDFSGGYQIRLNLAKVLLGNPDCLLLDEPTNYLDIVSMRWLSRFLRNFSGEVIIITHDRAFMDSVTTHTMGIWRQRLVKIKGSSTKYHEQILLEEEVYEKTRQNTDKKRKELEEFVARFKAKASKAAQAQSRMKLLEKLPEHEALAMMASLDFEFNYKECPGKVLAEIKDISFGYNKDNLLIEDLSFTVLRNDKIAIIGKNGKGKSTLLNLIAKELTPVEGSISGNVNLLMGHFGQTNIQRLRLENTIEEEISSADPNLGRERVRSICGVMMFSGDLAKKKISVLSGGERARVLLGKLLAKPTNLLLLDEPTNHLDQDSVDALSEELQNYPGAVIIVTHSEGMLREVATKLVIFHHDRVEYFPQNYDDFLKKIGWEEEEQVKVEKPKEKISREEQRRLRQEIIGERSKALSPLKKKMEQLEAAIMKSESDAASLEEGLIAKPDPEGFRKLGVLKKKVDEEFETLAAITLEHDEKFSLFEKRLQELE